MTNLTEGLQITTRGVSTRIIDWLGNGFQTQSVHVLTLPPDHSSRTYRYDMAEETLPCLKGKGEVLPPRPVDRHRSGRCRLLPGRDRP
jgi:hypothetical protein